jgi:serine/threonine-protein phosphatase PP1 catalytic subunit
VVTLDGIAQLMRFGEIPDDGPICDLLWSDPDAKVEDWAPSDRGETVFWGLRSATKFLNDNGLEMIVRGHQIADEGFEYPFEPDRSVVTVFSASCSPDDFENKACFMTIQQGIQPKFTVLPAVKLGGRATSRIKNGGLATAKRGASKKGKCKKGRKAGIRTARETDS